MRYRNNELEIKSLFSGIIGLDTDDPKHSDIILEMYTGESDIRKEFNNHVYTIIKRNWTKLDKKEFTAAISNFKHTMKHADTLMGNGSELVWSQLLTKRCSARPH